MNRATFGRPFPVINIEATMPRSSRVTTADVRALLHLSGELHEISADRETRVLHVLRRLGDLVGCPVCSMQEVDNFNPGANGHPTKWAVMIGDDSARALFERFAHEAQNQAETVAYLAKNPGRAVLRHEFIPDSTFFKTVMFNEFARPAGIDLSMAGSYLLPRAGGVIGFSFNRGLKERRFGRRERELLQIFSDEFGWFMRSIAARAESSLLENLPLHQRRVLERLLAGDSEKQVAGHLNLSPHTVHDYVKALYARFNVSSRAELLIAVLGPSRVGRASPAVLT